MNALHSGAVKSRNTVRESCCSFASLIQRFQTFFTQKIAAVSKFANDFEREALIELRGSRSESKPTAKGQLERLIGGYMAFPGAGAVVPRQMELAGLLEWV